MPSGSVGGRPDGLLPGGGGGGGGGTSEVGKILYSQIMSSAHGFPFLLSFEKACKDRLLSFKWLMQSTKYKFYIKNILSEPHVF